MSNLSKEYLLYTNTDIDEYVTPLIAKWWQEGTGASVVQKLNSSFNSKGFTFTVNPIEVSVTFYYYNIQIDKRFV